ncbi:MAG: redoxin domain-containing protein [Deltaproteobacteria bacterium]|nr:redoxin domain-containing protein [Deltaproteobacteria bacterium]
MTKKNKQFMVFFAIIILLWAAKDLFLKGSGDNGATLTILSLDRIIEAPTFELPDIEGRQRGLDDFRGHYVLLNFWATW